MPEIALDIIDVGAGLVFKNGRLLITRRRAQDHLGGLWEFPGGKREGDESFEACVRRELMEEVGIEVEIKRPFQTVIHTYPEKTVHLKFFECAWIKNEARPIGCAELAWVRPGELRRYSFPAADIRLIDRIVADRTLWKTDK